MAKEVERKFLVRDDGWRADAGDGVTISQFYVAAALDRTVRLRIRGDGRALLTLKFGAASLSRDEFEYEVPLADARVMQPLAIGNVIEKTRYRVPHRGHIYEVDVFARALAGLVVAELETEATVADAELPPWLGREVTGDAAFYNASLAMEGLPETA